MSPSPCSVSRHTAGRPTTGRRSRGRARVLVAGAVVALAGLLAGCGLRLETPPPAPPTPGVSELARQRTIADAIKLEVLAAAPGGDPADPVTVIRSTVVAQAGEHLAQLGVNPAGLATPRPTSDPSPVPTAAKPAATTPDVVAQLVQAATTARTDAAAVPDGPLARLLASVSVARLLLARSLAAASGAPAPELPAVTVPGSVPAGAAPSALSALVLGEDEAGYGFEVIAAKLSDAARSSALDRATVHRARADQWASLAQIARTRLDPRRAAYALPAGLDDPAAATALAQSLELSLAASYASLVTDAEPGSRPVLVDALTEASAQAGAWGAPPAAFPGLPERTTG